MVECAAQGQGACGACQPSHSEFQLTEDSASKSQEGRRDCAVAEGSHCSQRTEDQFHASTLGGSERPAIKSDVLLSPEGPPLKRTHSHVFKTKR